MTEHSAGTAGPQELDFELLELEGIEPVSAWSRPALNLRDPSDPAGVAVSKLPLRLRLSLSPGEQLEGDVFVALESVPSTEEALSLFVQDLNDSFFPLRDHRGQTLIVHSRFVQWFATSRSEPAPDTELRRRVRIGFGHGHEVAGVVHLDVATLNPRVSDLLNDARPYFRLRTAAELVLVSRNWIRTAVDLGPADQDAYDSKHGEI
jgi:hypothetical protein